MRISTSLPLAVATGRDYSMSNTSNRPDLPRNHILADLPMKNYQALLAHMTEVKLAHGEVLYEIGQAITQVYFPNDAVVSLVYTTIEGTTVEVGLVGREGMVGIPFMLGAKVSPHRAVVQVSDGAMKVKASILREEFNKAGSLHDLLLGYTHGLMMQVSRTAVCNRIHKIEERLARWLLMVQDRMLSDEFRLTHDFIADMLGVRRAGVTLAAGMLQQSGLIHYHRGEITIIDREGLESVACECYGVGRLDFSTLR